MTTDKKLYFVLTEWVIPNRPFSAWAIPVRRLVDDNWLPILFDDWATAVEAMKAIKKQVASSTKWKGHLTNDFTVLPADNVYDAEKQMYDKDAWTKEADVFLREELDCRKRKMYPAVPVSADEFVCPFCQQSAESYDEPVYVIKRPEDEDEKAVCGDCQMTVCSGGTTMKDMTVGEYLKKYSPPVNHEDHGNVKELTERQKDEQFLIKEEAV